MLLAAGHRTALQLMLAVLSIPDWGPAKMPKLARLLLSGSSMSSADMKP
jgi:hypothetical protein